MPRNIFCGDSAVETVFGKDDARTAKVLDNYARLLSMSGRGVEAATFESRAQKDTLQPFRRMSRVEHGGLVDGPSERSEQPTAWPR